MKNIIFGLSWIIIAIPACLLAVPDYFVDADWLSEHIDDESVIVLEVR